MSKERRRLYRSRDGVILGVCRGMAEYFDFSVFWTRVAAVLILVFTGVWPILGIYIAAGILMKPKPAKPICTEEEQEFYDSYTHSRGMALHRLKRSFDGLNRRIQRMEDMITASDYDWDRRLNEQR
jgi:phage shock protein C